MTTILPGADRKKVAAEFPSLVAQIIDTAGYYLSRAEVFSLTGREARSSYDSAAAAYQRLIRERREEPYKLRWD